MLCDVISKYVMQAARLANKIQGFGIAIWAHKNWNLVAHSYLVDQMGGATCGGWGITTYIPAYISKDKSLLKFNIL